MVPFNGAILWHVCTGLKAACRAIGAQWALQQLRAAQRARMLMVAAYNTTQFHIFNGTLTQYVSLANQFKVF